MQKNKQNYKQKIKCKVNKELTLYMKKDLKCYAMTDKALQKFN